MSGPVINALTNLDLCVEAVKNASGRQQRLKVINKLLEGQIDYSSPNGKNIGTRRALLCTRLADEGLWP